MRVALCQLNPTVGDAAGNAARICEFATRAARAGARLAVFPELALSGYPPRDLLERDGFLRAEERAFARLVAELPPDLYVALGHVGRRRAPVGRRLRNVASVVHAGAVAATVGKRLLPTYDVFDEDRYFEPADEPPTTIEIDGVSVGVTICEDIWNDVDDEALAVRRYRENPVSELVRAGARLILNLSASPFTLRKRWGRERMLKEVARHHAVPVVFVNQVGGNDDLVFDGQSAVFSPDGGTSARARAFDECLLVTDAAGVGERFDAPGTDEAAALDALVLGTRDYARKCGFRRAVLGLSGGVDSALVACIATLALGPDAVLGVSLPTRYSSAGSLSDAAELARNLGHRHRVIDVDALFQKYLDELTPHLDAIAAAPVHDVTFENVQSRIRCAVLMALSNREGSLLLTTGNKSELAVGYCTLYGDMAGGLAVISDLPKTFVYRVAREVNRRAGRALIPETTLTKAPSAELRPDQRDEDSLPPYDVLDPILERLVEQASSVEEIVADGFDEETVRRVAGLVTRSEYKRRQMPPGLIVTRKAFGVGRRYPIAQGYVG